MLEGSGLLCFLAVSSLLVYESVDSANLHGVEKEFVAHWCRAADLLVSAEICNARRS